MSNLQRQEASVFFTREKLARIPRLDRQYSEQFIDVLYSLGARVEVSRACQIGATLFVVELTVIANYTNHKQVLLELLKTSPYRIEEAIKNTFKINWLGSNSKGP